MRRFLALVLSLTMLLQLTAFSIAEETEAVYDVKIVFADADGEEYTAVLKPGDMEYGAVYNTNGSISSSDVEDDTRLKMEVTADTVALVEDDGSNVIYIDSNTDLELNGNVEGSIVLPNHVETEFTYIEGEDSEIASEKQTFTTTDSTMTMVGNITQSGNGAPALQVEGEAYAEVTGNVEAFEQTDGVRAYGNSTTVINGSVSAEKGIAVIGEATEINSYYYNYENGDLDISFSSASPTITVNGNVSGLGTVINLENHEQYTSVNNPDGTWTETNEVTLNSTTVIVNGNVKQLAADEKAEYDPEMGEYGTPPAIVAEGEANVTINGSISAQGNAIVSSGDSIVHVTGNVSSESGMGIEAYNTYEKYVSTMGYIDGEWVDKYDYSNEHRSGKVTVDGNVQAPEGAILARIDVTVHGDVASDKYGVQVGNESYDAEYRTDSPVNLVIDGSIQAKSFALEAGPGAVVNVGGDVSSENSMAVSTYGGASVTIEGDVTSEHSAAIVMNGSDKVTILGNVTGGDFKLKEEETDYSWMDDEYREWHDAYMEGFDQAFKDYESSYRDSAVEVQFIGKDKDVDLVIAGTVSANGDSVPVVVSFMVDNDEKLAEIPEVPEMKIYEILPNNGDYFDVNVYLRKEFEIDYIDEETGEKEIDDGAKAVKVSDEDHAAMVEAIAHAIQYIIKIDGDMKNAAIDIDKNFYDEKTGFYTAHEGEEVAVTLKPDDGMDMDLTATGNYTLTQNADGTWTLKVERGGGVTLSAVITQKSVEQAAEEDADTAAEIVVARTVQNTPAPHYAVGKIVQIGEYDLDHDGTVEKLQWRILNVINGIAQIALVQGLTDIPDDFLAAFDKEFTAAIVGDISVLDSSRAKALFGDEMIHPVLNARISALGV